MSEYKYQHAYICAVSVLNTTGCTNFSATPQIQIKEAKPKESHLFQEYRVAQMHSNSELSMTNDDLCINNQSVILTLRTLFEKKKEVVIQILYA